MKPSELRERYGTFYDSTPKVTLAASGVPKSLWALIPYAEIWGVSDDLDREHLIMNAPPAAIDDLPSLTREFEEDLDIWLSGDEAKSKTPSREYVSFSAMRMASDFV